MTPEDFRRNFAQSFLGIHPSAISDQLKTLGVWDRIELISNPPLIPASTPQFAGGIVQVSVILKLIDDQYQVHNVQMPWQQDMDEKVEICYSHHPRLGMVQTEDSIGFLRRSPQRQYNRGYSPRFCSIYVPNGYTAISSRTSSHAVVWSVFNPNHRTLAEALDMLDAGLKLGVVIAPLLGVCIEQGKRYPRLVYRQEIVGFIQNGDPIVYEGCSDACKDYIIKVTGKMPKIK